MGVGDVSSTYLKLLVPSRVILLDGIKVLSPLWEVLLVTHF